MVAKPWRESKRDHREASVAEAVLDRNSRPMDGIQRGSVTLTRLCDSMHVNHIPSFRNIPLAALSAPPSVQRPTISRHAQS